MLEDPLEARRRFAGRRSSSDSRNNQSLQADAYRTPYSGPDGVDVSGVELCATALANLLDASYLRRPGPIVELAGLFAWSVVLMLAWLCLAPRMAMFATLLALTRWGGICLRLRASVGAGSASTGDHSGRSGRPRPGARTTAPDSAGRPGARMEHGLSRQAFERLEGVLAA